MPDMHPLEREVWLENKREIEKDSLNILAGKTKLHHGKESKEFRPELPDSMKGLLLRGLRGTARGFETVEDAKRKHKLAVQFGLLDKGVKVRYLDNGNYEVIEAVG